MTAPVTWPSMTRLVGPAVLLGLRRLAPLDELGEALVRSDATPPVIEPATSFRPALGGDDTEHGSVEHLPRDAQDPIAVRFPGRAEPQQAGTGSMRLR